MNGDIKEDSFTVLRTAKPRRYAMLIGLVVSVAVFAFAHQSQATLGEHARSVESDRAVLSAETAVITPGDGYTVHEMASSAVALREYVTPSGVIFAVAWNGLSTPDLDQILGSYAGEYQAALQGSERQKGNRHLQVKSQNIKVERWGHMRALHGRAYIPALIPPGVSADVIKPPAGADSGTHITNWHSSAVEDTDVSIRAFVKAATSPSVTQTITGPANTDVIQGGTWGPISSSITNNTSPTLQAILYAFIENPKNQAIGGLTARLTIGANHTENLGNIEIEVSRQAAAGNYQFCGYIYNSNGTKVLDTKCIGFTVVAATPSPSPTPHPTPAPAPTPTPTPAPTPAPSPAPVGSNSNVVSLTVNGAQCNSSINAGYINEPCISVTVCTPGSSTCQTISGILLDTGSYGLRIFKQALSGVSFSQVASGSGSLAECVEYADGSSDWGPVQTASVILGGEPAVQVPIQVIDHTFGSVPKSCGVPDQSPADAGFNGILGVGPFIQDCGPACASSASNGMYYSCAGSKCNGTAVALASQVENPVALLPTDNAGLIVELPSVAAGGAASASGSVVFGIGTLPDNAPAGVTMYPLNQDGEFTTTFNGSTYTSFIDTGSNALYFSAGKLLPLCTGANSEWYCPSTTTSLSAAIKGATGSPSNTDAFEIGNFLSLVNSSNMVFSDVGGSTGSMGSFFDWGLPFYFGHNVYIGFEGKTSSLGTGPYFAY